jgi:DNA invertase Pin-like site-specific DNA recombinase
LNVRTLIYVRQSSEPNGTEAELLRKSVEGRGDTVIASFADDPAIVGRGKNAGWNAMFSDLDNIDQIVVGCAGDLPGTKVQHLLAILLILQDRSVGLRLNHENIDTGVGTTATLDLIDAYRAVKLSEAIRHGISWARVAGKVIGRPAVPDHVRRRVMADLAQARAV